MKDKIKLYKTLSSYIKELEDKGYNVLYIGLYGSQNYNLSDENSDVDARAIVLPSVRQMLTGKKISKTIEVSNGQVDVKDLVTFVENLIKGNPAYIESAQTEVFIGDKEIRKIIENFPVKPMAIYGMAMEKFAAIEKGIPATAPTVEKYGYDTKQLHHIIRLGYLLEAGRRSKKVRAFANFPDEGLRKHLMGIKRGKSDKVPSKEYVTTTMLENFKTDFRDLVDEIPYEQPEFPEEVYDYLEKKMIEGLFKMNDTHAARNVRTFNSNIPKQDLEAFPMLEEHQGNDISYTVYSYLEFLGNYDK